MKLQDLNSNVSIKLLTIVLAITQPLLILFYLGQIHSISSVWDSFLQPLFIITNAATSFYFLLMDRWRVSGVMLMLLTAFSVNIFPLTHNCFALIFFISIIYGFKTNYLFISLYMISIPLFFMVNMLWAEIYAIFIISIYHLDLLLRINRVNDWNNQH
jgi:hypothetical protein